LPRGQTLHVAAFPGYLAKSVLDGFESQTGNKVVVETYRSNEELIARLAENRPYDLIVPSSYAVERLLREQKILPLNRERIPNAANIPTLFRNPPFDPGLQYCVPYVWSLLGLGMKTDHAKDIGPDPSHWPDLFSVAPLASSAPRPKVVMLDDMRATLGVALRALGRSASSQSAADLLAAQELLIKQLPRVTEYLDDPSVPLSRGDVTLALSWSTELFDLIRKRPNIRFVLPIEGTLLYVDYACVPKPAAQPEVAFALLNYLLDPFIAAQTTNATMLATANQEARKLLDVEARWMWGTFDSLTTHARAYEVLRDVGAAQPLYDRAWATVKQALATQQAQQAAALASERAATAERALAVEKANVAKALPAPKRTSGPKVNATRHPAGAAPPP
jgi:spermidine/putrescine transport system substrate-binding protein